MEYIVFIGEFCMIDCKEIVEIMMCVCVLDVMLDNVGVEEVDVVFVMVSSEFEVVEEVVVELVVEFEVVEVVVGFDLVLVVVGENLFCCCVVCY